MARKPITMSRDELLKLPVTVDLRTAAKAFGLGRTLAYALAQNDNFPCRVLKLGERYKVTRADLFRALGVEDPQAADTAA